MDADVKIRPQPKQQIFLKSPADIVIYGGAAGGGKTYSLLLDPVRFLQNGQFGSVIFRRTYTEIAQEKGIWDEAEKLYPPLGGKPNNSSYTYTFPSGARVRFAHLQHEDTKYRYKSAQIAHLGFDELTSFTRSQFIYMLSRNRSISGMKPRVRAATNPDNNWVADLLAWWICHDEDSPRYGFPLPERAGRIRFFTRRSDDSFVWGNSITEVVEQYPAVLNEPIPVQHLVKSLQFIPADIYDNQVLLDENPQYLSNLLMQDRVERERLLKGNWLVKPSGGDYFTPADFPVTSRSELPSNLRWYRHWDLAGTEPSQDNPNPPSTVGSLLARDSNRTVYWADCQIMQVKAADVERRMRNIADRDGPSVTQVVPQDPGQAGVAQVKHLASNVLAGYDVRTVREQGDKEVRIRPVAAAAQRGEIVVVKDAWNQKALNELERVPDGKWDVADTLSSFWAMHMTPQKRKRQRGSIQQTVAY